LCQSFCFAKHWLVALSLPSSHEVSFSTCYCAVLLCIDCVHCAEPRPKCLGLLLTASVRRSRHRERESQEELKKWEKRSDHVLLSVLVEIRLLNFLFYPSETTLAHIPDIDFDICSGISLTSTLYSTGIYWHARWQQRWHTICHIFSDMFCDMNFHVLWHITW
jgi:hypothetical protein